MELPWIRGSLKFKARERGLYNFPHPDLNMINWSAVADHSTSTGHNIKWDHFENQGSGQCDTQRKVKETLLIRDLKPMLNEKNSSEKLFIC